MDEILFEEFDYRALCRISGVLGMYSVKLNYTAKLFTVVSA